MRWGESHRWGLAYGSTTDRNADNQCCGQTYLDLHALDPRPERIRDLKTAIDHMVNSSKRDDWWWIDALQMAMPIFARFGVLTGDPRYFSAMYELYSHTRRVQGGSGLYNPVEHLWWRDADFDPPYREPNGAHCYWSRGNGWVFAALVRVLAVLPADEAHRAEYLQTFQDMAAALAPLQRADGFWNVSLKDPDNYGGRELTGTAFFTYGLAWGITQGHLPRATFLPHVVRAWRALATHAVRADGTLAYVQGTGKQPSDSQPVTSDSAPNFDDFGTGAFLLAGTEVHRLAVALGLERIRLLKTWTINQTSPALSHPGPPGEFEARLEGAVDPAALGTTAVRVVSPGGTSALELSGAHGWSAAVAAGSTLFPEGAYTVELGTRTLAGIQLGSSGPSAGFAAIPLLTLAPAWGRHDVARPLTIGAIPAAPPATPAVETHWRVVISGPDYHDEREFAAAPAGSPVNLTVPPYALTAGKTYAVQVDCERITHRATVDLGPLGSAVLVEAGLRTSTRAVLEMTAPSHANENLVNLSARGIASADQPLIAGFTISPGGPKMVLLRAAGPALQSFGVEGALANPMLRVANANRTRSWQNDDWQSTPQYLAHDPTGATVLQASYTQARDVALAAREAGAFPFAARSRDAALVVVLPPGGYTALVTPSGTSAPGPALVEVYELATTSTHPRLTNFATRGQVSGSSGPLLTGFVIAGGAKSVLVRALGPVLTAFGLPAGSVLTQPRLTLRRSDGLAVLSVDPALAESLRQRVGAFALPAGSADLQRAYTLGPGAYTAEVSAEAGGAGTALIEVYVEAPGT